MALATAILDSLILEDSSKPFIVNLYLRRCKELETVRAISVAFVDFVPL